MPGRAAATGVTRHEQISGLLIAAVAYRRLGPDR